MALNVELLGKYARIYLARKKLRDKDKDLTDRLQQMEQALIDHMQDQGDDGVDQISLKGGRTLQIKTTLWGKILTSDKTKLVNILRVLGLGHIVSDATVNHQKLAGYLRELDRDGEKIPPELEEKQRKVHERYEQLVKYGSKSVTETALLRKYKEPYIKKLEDASRKVGQRTELHRDARRIEKEGLDDALDAIDTLVNESVNK